MADILIIPTGFAPGGSAGKAMIQGQAIEASNNYTIGWAVEVSYSDNASQVNAAIRQAAVDEFGRAEPPYAISGGDKKTLLGSAS